MRTIYQPPKSQVEGVNLYEGYLEKQREIDRLKEEIARLRIQLSQKKRKDRAVYFGSSTPSAKQPLKANSPAEAEERHKPQRLRILGPCLCITEQCIDSKFCPLAFTCSK
jgi:hypothetical protein